MFVASHVYLPGQERSDEEDKIDFKGGNVHVISNKENWDHKIAEANKDGKIVSNLQNAYIFTIGTCQLWKLRKVSDSIYNMHMHGSGLPVYM